MPGKVLYCEQYQKWFDMKNFYSILALALAQWTCMLIPGALYAQDGEVLYVQADHANPHVEITDKQGAFGKQLIRPERDEAVTVLDDNNGRAFLKVRYVSKDGKVVDGWMRRSVLGKEKVSKSGEGASSVGMESAAKTAKGSVNYDTIPPNWDKIDLTSPRMKPGYPYTPPDPTIDRSFPWIPVAGGAAAVGVITYILISKDGGDDCNFTVNANVTGATCSLPNGIAAIVANPPDNYAYNWSNGATGATQTGLAPGSYIVTVTRAGTSCNRIANIIIPNTDPAFDINVTTTFASCGVSDGAATVQASPSGSYTYTWSNGATGASQNNLAAGNYAVTVSAGGSCTRSTQINIPERSPEFQVTVSTTPADCGSASGTATAVADPPGNYSYLWSNGATGPEASSLITGAYQVTVTITGTTCSVTAGNTVDELPPAFTAVVNTTPAGCGLADGTATVTVDPPGNYEYLWSSGSIAPEVSGLTAGTYQVTVTISGTTCAIVESATIDEQPAEYDVSISTTPANCKAEDGTAVLTVNPPGEYEFVWSNGNTGPEGTGLAPGTYEVTVSIAGTKCSAIASFTIDELPPPFTVQVSTTPSGCGTTDGTATATADPPGNYTYEWSTGATTASAEGLPPGKYVVLVTDESGCCVEASITVEETPVDYIVSVVPVPGNCLGDGADIIVTTQTTGDGPMEITATGPDGVHVITTTPGSVSLSTFFIVLPGEWHLVVTDLSLGRACADEDNTTVELLSVFVPLDDAYKTIQGQPISGNVLDNDMGIGLIVVDHTQPVEGVVMVNQDGSFTYTPGPETIGVVSFEYTVMDACGETQRAHVTITINPGACVFETTFTTIPTHCGLTDGSVTSTVDPPGEYTYVWSNGSTTADVSGLGAGEYHVTITSIDLDCSNDYTVTIDEVPAEHITSTGTTPGTCTGGGDIQITLITGGDGPLVVTVTGPEDSQQVTLPEGQHSLSAFMNIVSGDYTISVYDQGAGESCTESVDVTVPDNTPALVPVDDFYETPFNTPVSGNMLDNDNGHDIIVESVSSVIGGVVDWQPDGAFTFTPDFGFQGIGGFIYTVRDGCGNTENAIVEIFVAEGICDFTVQFVNTNASCGLQDGTAFAFVDPPGTYFYQWSNGATGPMLSNAGAGFYSVTIEDLNIGCALTFDTEVGENPAMYVSNVEVVQPECPVGGDIRFEVSSPGSGPILMMVSHPNGFNEFVIPEGLISLAEYISITDGDYNVTITDFSAGPECTDVFNATIEGTVTLTIDLEGVFPPSEPSGMDGQILVVVTMPTMPPYNIWLNGDGWGVALGDFIEIGGLAAGPYTVQIQDENGCFSNILNVVVPIPGTFGLQLGMGIASMGVAPSGIPELPGIDGSSSVQSFVQAVLTYRAVGYAQESHVSIFPGNRGYAGIRFAQLTELTRYRHKGLVMRLQGGLSIDAVRGFTPDPFVELRGNTSLRIGRMITADLSASLRGWHRIERPLIAASVRLPIVGGQGYHWRHR